MKILVTGATGTVGSTLVRRLAAAGVPARGLVRRAEAAAEIEALGLQPAIGAFEDRASLDRALRGVDTVFLLSPPGADDMVAAQAAVVDRAVAAGVRRVVKLSSIAADEPGGPRIIRAHRAIEERIEASGLAWTHLRPHWFMDNELGQAASIAAERVFFAPDIARIAPIDARDVAEVAARVLAGDGHDGRAYVLTGPELASYADLAAVYGRVLGVEVSWAEVTLDQARASMVAAGLPAELAAGFAEILARYREGGATARVSPDAAALLGRPPRDLSTFVADHRDAFAVPEGAAA